MQIHRNCTQVGDEADNVVGMGTYEERERLLKLRDLLFGERISLWEHRSVIKFYFDH